MPTRPGQVFKLPPPAEGVKDPLITKVLPEDLTLQDILSIPESAKLASKLIAASAIDFFEDDSVWVWSCSAQSWCPGRVKTATDHSLELEYRLPDKTWREKDLPQRHEEVRARHSAVDD